MTHRSWFPTILTGLSLALLAIIVVAYKNDTPQVSTPVPATVIAPTSLEYESAARSVVRSYEAGGNPATSYNALIAMTVPVEYKDAHIELVFAFADLKAGKAEEGAARLDVARTAYPWLTTP